MSDPRRLLEDGSEASPLLRQLLASAKRADEPSPSHIASVAAGLAPLLAPSVPPPPVAAPAATGAGHAGIAAKVGAAIVALGVIGGGVWYVQPPREPRARPAMRQPAIITFARVAALVPDAREVAPEPVVAPTPEPVVATAPAPVTPPRAPKRVPRPAPQDREAEGKLVLAAEAALVRGDVAAALAVTREHAMQFPAGAHAEERDRIAIEALVRLGRADRAHAAADRFFTRYPRSIYRARLESLLR